MNPWLIVAALSLAIASGFVGSRIGTNLERAEWERKELARAERIIVRQEVLIRKVPKIVEKVVVREKVIEKEVDRVVTVIESALAPDCVLPDRYGELLVGAARGISPDASGRIEEAAGEYGCREVLAATLKDLKAGWQNTERLAGAQQWAQIVVNPTKGSDP